MTIVETVLVFALIPLAIYGVITLLTLRPKATRIVRYRPGQEWGYAPVWWSANPGGLTADHHHTEISAASGPTARGGARGNW
ncbi:aa3-type cytochrome oxidase subunit CtaJ [Actinosynnema sp. CS-041913]|uniref:aa3-type cytochrome oxidase subunit CtaJ n=1 Tax=Actinosynnema sp. CS-041913 TaxID=3239917 RepID=UPI003D92B52F